MRSAEAGWRALAQGHAYRRVNEVVCVGKGACELMARRQIQVPVFAIMLILGSGSIAAAENATPSAEGNASCADVAPRDSAFFATLSATVPGTPANVGAQGQGGASPTPFKMPEGESADEATVSEIGQLYQQLVGCLNAGDYLRAYAFYSDDYLRRNLSSDAINRLRATPVPVEQSQQSAFRGVLDARVTQEGQVVALVSVTNPQTGDVTIFSRLAREAGRWRIDDEMVVEAEIPGTPVAGSQATPTS